ncbi:NAD(P)/FAD-dependent oxidoreductase [Rhodococcus sp. MEB064]|uniref:NAD(P)/FAD-dependent oxidoreductase n=1 Tax=Rhodococcus sp. MEB064 TaxID=1587522 RepID=UPI0005AC6D09|nr:FAD-dependent oxidoreductase [Rhodococcus sp. MEB064]
MEDTVDNIVVVGGSVAGVHAVEAARERGYRGSLTLMGAESEMPYDRPPLVESSTGGGKPIQHLRPAAWYDAHDVTLLRDCRAIELDPGNRVVRTSSGLPVPYAGLVIATGSQSRGFAAGGEHLYSVRSHEDAEALRGRLTGVEHVVVIGAGFLGLELTAGLALSGRRVTVIEVAPAPLARVLGDAVGRWFLGLHEQHGVDIMCSTLAVAVDAVDDRYIVQLADGESITADLVVAATGAEPAVEWLRGSGLDVTDGVVCNAALETTLTDVVAAGDIARWYNPLFDESMRVQQWTNAVEQGRHAMASLLGSDEPFTSVPFLGSDQYDARMRFVGVSNAADSVRIEQPSSGSLVATYARDGVQVGALCINATGQLAHHAQRIKERAPM